jgi:hypothetical protein
MVVLVPYNYCHRNIIRTILVQHLPNGFDYDTLRKNWFKKAADIFMNIKLSWSEIAFFFMVRGFVVYDIILEWTVSKKRLMVIPDFINSTFHISGIYLGAIKAIILFALLASIFYFVLVFYQYYSL